MSDNLQLTPAERKRLRQIEEMAAEYVRNIRRLEDWPVGIPDIYFLLGLVRKLDSAPQPSK